MKKITFVLAVVAMFVTFAACNKEADTQITEGESIEAVFEVSAPELATKAISDGLTADKLFFYLYDKNNALLFETNSSEGVSTDFPVTFTKIADKKWSVKVRLIKDMQYKIVFWAQKSGADAFTLDAAAKTISVNYSNMTLNADDEDAFWGTVGTDPADPFIVTGPATKVVTLKRPFAQLNVAIPAEDLGVASFMLGKYSKSVAAITTNYTLSSYAYNTMNLLDGTVSENAAETTPLTLVAQAQPNADITIGDKTYKHMAMAYVLVGDKVTNNVTLTVNTGAPAIGAEGVLTRTILNVPLQRNYRTNIIGSIFSVEEEFKVEIDNEFGETGTGAYGDVNVPDYVPTFNNIAALNAELAKGVDAVALDIASGTKITGDDIKLPNTTNDIHLYILNDHKDDESAINVVYTADAAAHPANLYVYAKNLYKMDGTVPDTHVEVYSYSYIGTGTISTSGTTLVIQPFAYYGNLRILKGGLKIEGIKDAEGNYEKDDNGNDAKGYVSMVVVEVPSEEAVQNVNIVNNGYLGGTGINAGIIVITGSSAVEGDVTVSGGADVTVNAGVTGNVSASDNSSLSLGENAEIGGDVEQKDNAEVSIDDGATVEGDVNAEDLSKISGEGAEDVEFLIKTEAELNAVISAGYNNGKLGANVNVAGEFTLDTKFVLDLNEYTLTFSAATSLTSSDISFTNGTVAFNEVHAQDLHITAGQYSEIVVIPAEGESEVKFISGGVFKVAPDAYVVPGKGCSLNGDGWYDVVDAIASIGTKIYGSIESAFAAALPGDTVLLLMSQTLSDAVVVPGKVTFQVPENLAIDGDAKLYVLGSLSNAGSISAPVIVLTEVYTVERQIYNDPSSSEYAVKATYNGAIENTGTISETPVYYISLDDGQSWFVDTNNGATVAVRVDNATKTKYLKTSLGSGFLQSELSTNNDNCTYHLLKDATTYSSSTKSNYGPMLSYCGFIFEGNGHTITLTAHTSGANATYSGMKLQTLHDATITVNNLTIDNANYGKHGIDIVPQVGVQIVLNVHGFNALRRKSWGAVLNGNSGKGICYLNQYGSTYSSYTSTGTGPNNMTAYWQNNKYTVVSTEIGPSPDIIKVLP